MEFTSEIKKATEPIYQKISKAIPEIEWKIHAPLIHKINKLKKELENGCFPRSRYLINLLEEQIRQYFKILFFI